MRGLDPRIHHLEKDGLPGQARQWRCVSLTRWSVSTTNPCDAVRLARAPQAAAAQTAPVMQQAEVKPPAAQGCH